MDVILLERVAKLGQMGEVVRVRDGYGRNFLLPRGKALRATEANKQRFADQRAQLEERNLDARNKAAQLAERIDGTAYVLIRQAGESGSLYGSVSARDVSAAMAEEGFTVDKNQITINSPIKSLGLYTLSVVLHPEVDASITVNVARSAEEAERQARGEAASIREEFNLDDLGLEVGAALAEAGPNAEM
jgi:large subunit ribosomal protein L9